LNTSINQQLYFSLCKSLIDRNRYEEEIITFILKKNYLIEEVCK